MPCPLSSLIAYDRAEPMLFTGGQFLLWFSVFFVGFMVLRAARVPRLFYLTAFSWFFYYKCSGPFVLALLATTAADYAISQVIARSHDERQRRLLLMLSIALSGGALVYFKYTNFLVGGAAALLSLRFSPLDIMLPAGISFYTFESISYVVDVYRRKLQPARSFVEYAAYLAFFPHLMAGPIMRAADLLPELRADRPLDRERVGSGVFLVLVGLAKKAIVADYLARFSDSVFAGAHGLSGFEILLGVYCYAVQIYCDFSGYSDMAIGLGRLCGVDLPTNFRSPYAATSITDFWHRWHITLSSWLRDYIYIPLGGNRRGRLRTYVNLIATMLFGGLWHGASMSFVLWGAAHGVLLAVEKATARPLARLTSTLPARIASTVVTFHIVALLWIPFRASSLPQAAALLGRIFGDFGWLTAQSVVHARSTLLVMLLVGGLICLVTRERIEQCALRFSRVPFLLKAATLVAVIQATLEFRTADVQPFIYFQF